MAKRNTKLYKKVIKIINSCLNEEQLKNCYNYIEQIRLSDENLANALMYQYDVKKEFIYKK